MYYKCILFLKNTYLQIVRFFFYLFHNYTGFNLILVIRDSCPKNLIFIIILIISNDGEYLMTHWSFKETGKYEILMLYVS